MGVSDSRGQELHDGALVVNPHIESPRHLHAVGEPAALELLGQRELQELGFDDIAAAVAHEHVRNRALQHQAALPRSEDVIVEQPAGAEMLFDDLKRNFRRDVTVMHPRHPGGLHFDHGIRERVAGGAGAEQSGSEFALLQRFLEHGERRFGAGGDAARVELDANPFRRIDRRLGGEGFEILASERFHAAVSFFVRRAAIWPAISAGLV